MAAVCRPPIEAFRETLSQAQLSILSTLYLNCLWSSIYFLVSVGTGCAQVCPRAYKSGGPCQSWVSLSCESENMKLRPLRLVAGSCDHRITSWDPFPDFLLFFFFLLLLTCSLEVPFSRNHFFLKWSPFCCCQLTITLPWDCPPPTTKSCFGSILLFDLPCI